MIEYRFLFNVLKPHAMLGLLFVAAVQPVLAMGTVATTVDKQTGLRSWEWRQSGVSLQLVQRFPDQTRAFFQGRGFSSADADIIGRACVFQTIFRNDGTVPVSYDLNDWKINQSGMALPMQTRERWERRWRAANLGQGPLIAFRWSLLPTRQRFEPGDYNWGMTSFGLPPGTSFDLELSLMIDGNLMTGRITAITCAVDQP